MTIEEMEKLFNIKIPENTRNIIKECERVSEIVDEIMKLVDASEIPKYKIITTDHIPLEHPNIYAASDHLVLQ